MPRYIDADALCESYGESIEECHKWADEMRKSGNEEMVIRAEQSLATFVECSLRAKNAPTIDVVKHGRWIRTTKADCAWECSACGYGFCDNRTTYCYDCGAKMDETVMNS